MKLPDVLKLAVENEEWGLVCKAYTAITGQPLSPPKPKEPDWLSMDIDVIPTTNNGITMIAPDGLPGITREKAAPLNQNTQTTKNEKLISDLKLKELPLPPKAIIALEAIGLTTTAHVEDFLEENGDLSSIKGIGPSFNTKIMGLIAGTTDEIPINMISEEGRSEGKDVAETPKSDCVASSKGGQFQQNPNESDDQPARRQSMDIPEKRENRFHDDLSFKPDERVDLYPELGVQITSVRGGDQQTKPVNVVCSECGASDSVSPSLASGYSRSANNNTYRCNGCLVGRVSR